MLRLLIIPAVLLLTGCDVETKNPAEASNAVSINAGATGRVAFDFPFAQGEIKLPAAVMENSDFNIDGVKLMPGGKITGFRVDGGDGAEQVDLSFTAPVPPAEASAYFVEQFRAKGMTAEAAGDSVSGVSKDGTAFVMRFAPEGAGTKGTIVLNSKDKART